MSLVIGQIVYFGLRSAQFIASGLAMWKPRLHFRTADLRGYLGFGLCQMGERTVTYLSINVINLIIGRYLGAGVLGQYSVAYQMIVYPILRLNNVIMQVSFPIFAKFQDVNETLQRGYLHLARVISFTTFPIIVFAFVSAPVIVPLLLGPGWSDTVVIFQILCPVAIFRALGSSTVPTYLAKGRADLGFTWNFIVAVVNGVVFYLTAGYGIVALALAFAATSFLQFVVMQTITGRMIGLKWSRYLSAMAMNTAKSVAVGAMIYGAYVIGISAGTGDITLTVIMAAVAINTYAGSAYAFNRAYLRELWHLIVPGFGNKSARGKRDKYLSADNSGE
jgi:O-antigen/teichoic acid export membrane protein